MTSAAHDEDRNYVEREHAADEDGQDSILSVARLVSSRVVCQLVNVRVQFGVESKIYRTTRKTNSTPNARSAGGVVPVPGVWRPRGAPGKLRHVLVKIASESGKVGRTAREEGPLRDLREEVRLSVLQVSLKQRP